MVSDFRDLCAVERSFLWVFGNEFLEAACEVATECENGQQREARPSVASFRAEEFQEVVGNLNI